LSGGEIMPENELDIKKNIAGIEANLARGTKTIKEGHIRKDNPEGLAMEKPLTDSQIQNKQQKLREQEEALRNGSRRRNYFPTD